LSGLCAFFVRFAQLSALSILTVIIGAFSILQRNDVTAAGN
jgi:hypothetical protein